MLLAASKPAWAEPYLFEMLDQAAYLKSWKALFAGEQDVDPWLGGFARTRNAPAGPGLVVQQGGIAYQVNSVCKPHDCDNNQFIVLFAPDGTRAWGFLLKDKASERFFGRPDAEKKRLLRAAMHE